MNKRAVSPLIATVLLIAFAVALGAVVMNWSYDYAPDATQCSDVFLDFETIRDQPDVCFDPKDQVVRMTLNNRGSDIQGVFTTLIGTVSSNSEEVEQEIPRDAIEKIAFGYDATALGGLQKVIVIPVLQSSEGSFTCQDLRIQVESVGLC